MEEQNTCKVQTCICCNYMVATFYEMDYGNPTVLEKLLRCVPFIDLERVSYPVICLECYLSLLQAYVFTKRCLYTHVRNTKMCVQYSPDGDLVVATQIPIHEDEFNDEIQKLLDEIALEKEKLALNSVNQSGGWVIQDSLQETEEDCTNSIYTEEIIEEVSEPE